MIKKLEELNKKRKEVLKFIDLKKIDFNSSRRIIPIEAIKCNKRNFVDPANVVGITRKNFFTYKSKFKNNPILFKKGQINRGFLDFVNDLQIVTDDLCVEYYYFIVGNNLAVYKVAGMIGNANNWNSFMNLALFTEKRESIAFSLNKKKILFLLKINDALEKIINNSSYSELPNSSKRRNYGNKNYG
jgi:hypothetical protein